VLEEQRAAGEQEADRILHGVGAPDEIVLVHLTAEMLEAEGLAAGLESEPSRQVAGTPDHVGSEVVVLRG